MALATVCFFSKKHYQMLSKFSPANHVLLFKQPKKKCCTRQYFGEAEVVGFSLLCETLQTQTSAKLSLTVSGMWIFVLTKFPVGHSQMEGNTLKCE